MIQERQELYLRYRVRMILSEVAKGQYGLGVAENLIIDVAKREIMREVERAINKEIRA